MGRGVARSLSVAPQSRGAAGRRAGRRRHAPGHRGAPRRQPRAGRRARGGRRRRSLATGGHGERSGPARSVWRWIPITAPFKYRVAAGAVTSATFSVSVARIPRVTRIDLEYTYPPALGLKPRSERDGGDIYAPAGTTVRVRVHTDREVASARMTLERRARPWRFNDAGEPRAVVRDADYRRRQCLSRRARRSRGSVESGRHRILHSRARRSAAGRAHHADRPATARVTRLEEVDIEAQADDDYGIDRLELVYAVRGGTEQVVAAAGARRARRRCRRDTRCISKISTSQPGDFVSYYVRARDVARGKRSNEARSDIFFLEVRPFEQEFALDREPVDVRLGLQRRDRRARQRAAAGHRRHLEARSSSAGRRRRTLRARCPGGRRGRRPISRRAWSRRRARSASRR